MSASTAAKLVAAAARAKVAASAVTQTATKNKAAQEGVVIAAGRHTVAKRAAGATTERVVGASRLHEATEAAAKATTTAVADGTLASAETAKTLWTDTYTLALSELEAARAAEQLVINISHNNYLKSIEGQLASSAQAANQDISRGIYHGLSTAQTAARNTVIRSEAVTGAVGKATMAQGTATRAAEVVAGVNTQVTAIKTELAAAQEAAAAAEKIAELTSRLSRAEQFAVNSANAADVAGQTAAKAAEAANTSSVLAVGYMQKLAAEANKRVEDLAAKLVIAEEKAALAANNLATAQGEAAQAAKEVETAQAELDALRTAGKLGEGSPNGTTSEEESPSTAQIIWNDIKTNSGGGDVVSGAGMVDLDATGIAGLIQLGIIAAPYVADAARAVTPGTEFIDQTMAEAEQLQQAQENQKIFNDKNQTEDDQAIDATLREKNMDVVWAKAAAGKKPTPTKTENFTPAENYTSDNSELSNDVYESVDPSISPEMTSQSTSAPVVSVR